MEIKIKENKYGIPLDTLIAIGKRANNPKRNFLFISKVLGKHLEVYPDICKAAGYILSGIRYESVSPALLTYLQNPRKANVMVKAELNKKFSPVNPPLVIGFAETATGLGMAVASSIQHSVYYCTTRERNIADTQKLFSFEEEHSHATTHLCYDKLHTNFSDFKEIILVDDEITTGKSMLNLIKKLAEKTPVKKISILTILDWRRKEHINAYEKTSKETGIDIQVYSLLSGVIKDLSKEVYEDDTENILVKEPAKPIFPITTLERTKENLFELEGRFGITEKNISKLEKKCKYIASKIQKKVIVAEKKKILVLGDGENIYIPSRVASYLEMYGHDVRFRSTTRSPIYCDGTVIRDKYKYYNSEEEPFYLYNREDLEKYDRVIFLPEKDVPYVFSSNASTVLL